MTAPLKHSDPITVDVALGERAYDIVIGRERAAIAGCPCRRLAARRPHRVVTDRNVAKHWLEKTEASLADAGIATSRNHCRRRRGVENLCRSRTGQRSADRGQDRA